MSRTIIVVPCYNEASRLRSDAFREFAQRYGDVTFLFVNDGSRDTTGELLEELASVGSGRCEVLHLPRNCGKAEAVRRGMLEALRQDVEYLGFWDADLATPLSSILDFRRVLEHDPQIELVIGTRLRLLGRQIRRRTLRAVISRLFSYTISLMLGVRVRDSQCGAKLFRAGELTNDVFTPPFHTRWLFDVEILARVQRARAAWPLPPLRRMVYELPLDRWQEISGSRLRPRDFGIAVWDLLKIGWKYCLPWHIIPTPAPHVFALRSRRGTAAGRTPSRTRAA